MHALISEQLKVLHIFDLIKHHTYSTCFTMHAYIHPHSHALQFNELSATIIYC